MLEKAAQKRFDRGILIFKIVLPGFEKKSSSNVGERGNIKLYTPVLSIFPDKLKILLKSFFISKAFTDIRPAVYA